MTVYRDLMQGILSRRGRI